MYNILSKAQEQRIINVVECMRANDIQSMHFIAYGMNYYLSGIDTLMLDVEVTKKDNFTYSDSYTIDKDNYIDYQTSSYDLK